MDMYTQNYEQLLDKEILVRYQLPQLETVWIAHDKIGSDDVAHYFTCGDIPYVLVWSDFPNTTFIHEERLAPVLVKGQKDEWLHVKSGELAGHYSLYEDSSSGT